MMSTHGNRRWLLAVAGVVAALALVAGGLQVGGLNARGDSESTYSPPAMGSEDAPITMIEYGDFQ